MAILGLIEYADASPEGEPFTTNIMAMRGLTGSTISGRR